MVESKPEAADGPRDGALGVDAQDVRQREARLSALVAAGAYATYRMNADWSEMLEAEGQGGANVRRLGAAWLDSVYPEDRPHVLAAIKEAIAAKAPLRTEHRVLRPDGSTSWTLSRAVPLLGPDGEIVEWFGAVSDVSEQKQTEVAAQRLAAIVESSDDAIVSKDLNGVIVSWNNGAQRLFGYAANEVVGKHISILIPADRLNEEPTIIERIRRGERVDHYETVRRRKDGSFVDVSLAVSPIYVNGRVIGASKIARDISQRKQAELTRQLLLNELNHRVKNTLATVQAISQQTLRRTKDPADFAARFSGRIQSLSRVHALLTDATWQGADLRHLIRDQLLEGAVEESRLSAWGPSVRLTPQMAVHAALMLHELGTNSLKYGAFSSPRGQVSVSWTVKNDALHLKWVERGGPPCVTPFTRGFGTTLIEQSAKGEGGDAQMLCEAEGVTWNIALPLPRGGASGAALAEFPPGDIAPLRRGKARSRLAGLRFLVIEDEPLIALDIKDTLMKAGAAAAHSAGTEGEALGLIAKSAFDAALLDANLHGEPVDAIAVALVRGNIPFVFVTGYGRAGLPEAFQHVPVVPKPFSEQQLLLALTTALPQEATVLRSPNSPLIDARIAAGAGKASPC